MYKSGSSPQLCFINRAMSLINRAMEKQSKQGSMSKEKEWIPIEEKNYPLQGARPKMKAGQNLPPLGSNSNREKHQKLLASPYSGVGHSQQNKSGLPKLKSTQSCPQALLSVDNVSLHQQGNKFSYWPPHSAPLPRPSPSRNSPSRASPSPRKPYSASPQTSSAFQWPSFQEQPEVQGSCSRAKSEAAQTTILRVPHPPKQSRPAASKKSYSTPTRNEFNSEEENEAEKLPNLKNGQRRPASGFHRRLRPLNDSPGTRDGGEIFKQTNSEHNPPRTTSCYMSQRQSGISSNVIPLEPSDQQDIDAKISSLQENDVKETEKATIIGKTKGLLYKRKANDGVRSIENERWQKYCVPQQEKRERFSSMVNDRPHTLSNVQSDDRVVLHLVSGSRTPEMVSHSPQNVMPFQCVVNPNLGSSMTVVDETKNTQGIPKSVRSKYSSPDSFVAQLISNTEKLLLNDSTESSALQKKKTLARKMRKKFG